ncbi:MAG: hypothetical protein HOV68_25890 [Streptomycetaceae bacterium]|nr:hypothetical protein [Streptomycetaceae bacterium]
MSEDSRYDEDENGLVRDLPGALRAASDAFPGPSPDLIDRGHTRGRRMRRNRRIRIGVAGAALAAVAVSGAYVLPGLGGDADKEQTASGPTVSSGSPTPSAAPPAVSADQMLTTLKSLLPQGGTFTQERARGTEGTADKPAGGAFASLLYSDGKGGATGIDVSVERSLNGTKCPPIQVRPYAACTAVPLPDGSTLISAKGFTYPSSNKGQKMWEAELVRPDGVSVEVHAYGGGGEKATTSSVDPLLTLAEIETVAKSPAWTPAAASVASTPAPGSPPADGPEADKILALLKTFLPQGATVTDESGDSGYVSLVADDHRGRSSVGINLQRGMTDKVGPYMTCDKFGAQALSCTVETLADGSKLLLLKQKSEKGGGDAERWTADLLRPDGFRVAVSSINSYAEAAPPTRTAPILDLDRLKAVATDPQWATL